MNKKQRKKQRKEYLNSLPSRPMTEEEWIKYTDYKDVPLKSAKEKTKRKSDKKS